MSAKILDFRAEAAFPGSTLTADTRADFLHESQTSQCLHLGNGEAGACKVPTLYHYSSFIDASILLKIYGLPGSGGPRL